MPAKNPPSNPVAQLQWLVDRAAIRDLISDFGVSVDDKNQASYAANFTEDAVLVLPMGKITGRAAIAAMPPPPANWGAQHLFGNIVIDLEGDRAVTRAYMIATHIFDLSDITQNAHGGGWYEHEVVRTADGWRFSKVELVIVWEGDRPMLPGKPPTPVAAKA